jgi:DNA-directed RNA polymerase subunit RPC12/RpoP
MGLTTAQRYNRNLDKIFENAKILKATYTGHSCVICKEGITWEEDYTGGANVCKKCGDKLPL